MEGEAGTSRENEWEETFVVAELRGIHEAKGIIEEIQNGHSKVVAVGTENPSVVVGNHLFLGKWKEPFGTQIIFEKHVNHSTLSIIQSEVLNKENSTEKTVRYLDCSDRVLIADKATVVPSDSDTKNSHE